MSRLFYFDLFYLAPAALIGLAAAVVLFLVSRKKNGVRPPCAGVCRPLAFCLIGFAAVTLILIPLVHYLILFVRFALEFLYYGLKSI